MTYSLFIDDEREPPADGRDWVVARTYDEAIRTVLARGVPAYSSWDHDLGPGPTAMDFAHWFAEHVLDGGLSLAGFEFYVHSQNPIGARNIDSFLRNLKRAAG